MRPADRTGRRTAAPYILSRDEPLGAWDVLNSSGVALVLAGFASVALSAASALNARVLERRLYVTDRTGISVYDIDRGHAFVRKIDIPDSGDYPGIAASAQLGR